ncbi:hypothetical protein ACSMXM_05980 [Pacificimonas sp. ICDLI1SI03]
MRVLIAGEPATHSAPALSIGSVLQEEGLQVSFSEGAETTDQRRWLKLVRSHDLVIVTVYGKPTRYFARQLHMARLFGCRIIRVWVGTDVLRAADDAEAVELTHFFGRAIDLNIAMAEHLVLELAQIGVDAVFVPSVSQLKPDSVPDDTRPCPAVLVYLPASRKEFYREPLIAETIAANPDLSFIIVGDDTHCLAHFGNVESLGWVSDMQGVWNRAGVLLRLTQHDGLPRMVLDALGQGKYVIYSWPLQGCWYATDAESVNAALADFRAATNVNQAGMEAVRRIAGDGGAQLAVAVGRARRSTSRWHSFRGMISAHRRAREPRQ